MAMNLKAARHNAEKTQEEVAVCIGKTILTVRNYETYRSTPDVETAKKIADFYGMNVDDIKWSK